jgi:ankyrin repeat protein
VSRAKPDIVEILLSQPDIDAACGDFKGRCPLHRAVRRNCAEIMQLFRERASPANVRDHLQCTPLHYAVTRRPETLRMLLTFQGIDVNAQNRDGDTPLHIAALKGCVEQSRILLGTPGVNPHLRSRGGVCFDAYATPKRYSLISSNPQIADVFVGLDDHHSEECAVS